MHCSTTDIPVINFPRDEIIEIIPAAYQNEAKRIHIPGLNPQIVPGSPQDIKIPVPSSGVVSAQLSPIPSGIGTPAEHVERPPEKVINTAKDMVADKVNDED
jgi:6-phosphofructo-2-kinase / fructose-2,6-biphosphatase 4